MRGVVQRVRDGLAQLFALPEDYLVVLGNGGTTAFWDAAAFCLVDAKSQHLSFGEFSAKFAKVTHAAPWLAEPSVISSDPGTHPLPRAEAGVDAYALTHNETSTGVAMPVRRPAGADDGALVLVDATSAAGGIAVDAAEFDAYYFAPQKCFGADGGLWIALLSPAAAERVARITASDRYIPEFLSLQIAIDNSRLQQTYNTPAVATLILLAEQVEWMLANGGMAWTTERSAASSGILYNWADKSPVATPFVADPAQRSPVVVTIDLADSVDGDRGVQGAARQRDRGHRLLPQARPQPAADRHLPGGRPGRRRGAYHVHRLRGGAAGLAAWPRAASGRVRRTSARS